MCAAVAAVIALCAAFAAAADLHSVRFDDGSALVVLQAGGVRIRYIGEAVALVESEAGRQTRALESLGATPLGAVETGERLYECYPRSDRTELPGHGRVLLAEPLGAVIMAVRPEQVDALRSECFHVHELPGSIDAGNWFDDRPAPIVASRTEERELAVRGVVGDVISSVSTDSLMAHVRRLSTYPGGELRSRFVRREECLSEAKPYIMDRLSSYLPEGAPIETQRFGVLGYSCENDTLIITYPADNIVGTLPGTGRLAGYYIVCGHYDAIASHSFPGDSMWWCDNPAPGADDNGTGVAVVLEAARVLSGLTFPFDIRFILWSGEELGLLGSDAYADSVAAAGDTIYGVLNVDMVAYKPEASAPDTCHIVTNRGSTWLADWIVDTASLYPAYFDGFNISRIDRALAYSDHASFWFKGYDGLIAIEHWNPRDRNPYYHTTGDTIGNVSASQLAGVGRAVAGSVARLADPDGEFNLAVFSQDMSAEPDSPETGDDVRVSVKVHAFGPEQPVDMMLTVWDGEPDSGELMAEFDLSRVMGGGEVILYSFSWTAGSSDLGLNRLTARIETPGTTESWTTDNTAVFDLRVTDPDDLFVMKHYAYPNPAGFAGELNFRYELSRSGAAVEMRVFDITGQELGLFQMGLGEGEPSEGSGTSAGWNTLSWDSFSGPAGELASGVYIYQLKVYAEGVADPTDEVSGRFAVVR